MKPSAPSDGIYYAGSAAGILGLIGYFVHNIPVISQYPFWLLAAGFLLLFLGTTLRNL